MAFPARSRHGRAASFLAIAAAAGFLAACTSTPQPKGMVSKTQRSKEYFSEAEYGVKASPRVTTKSANLKRGGGRDQIGRPYKVRGKMYYPKEDKSYKKVGTASWYGDAFHGRLTANGEIYDMTHLTAAHPTMPLPSYARVTNVENGSSVIVRVNDRGPYSHGRLIDLSRRAAEMLDYTQAGTAKVKVEYVGRAPLEGHDDKYLMASYRPGKAMFDPNDGLPTGVMIAMNGPSPSADVGADAASPFPGTLVDAPSEPVLTANVLSPSQLQLPDLGPIAPERPAIAEIIETQQLALAAMSYAEVRVSIASDPFVTLGYAGMTPDDVAASWKRLNALAEVTATEVEPYVAAGTFADQSQAEAVVHALSAFGRASIEVSQESGSRVYSVNLYGDGRNTLDAMLESAWANGAPDALAVRD